jgi:hypothetical protein
MTCSAVQSCCESPQGLPVLGALAGDDPLLQPTSRHISPVAATAMACWPGVFGTLRGYTGAVGRPLTYRYSWHAATPRGDRVERDPNRIAARVVRLATGQDPKLPEDDERHAQHVESGRVGGRKGGPARAAKLTAEERSASAKRAAEARWQRSSDASWMVDRSAWYRSSHGGSHPAAQPHSGAGPVGRVPRRIRTSGISGTHAVWPSIVRMGTERWRRRPEGFASSGR